MDLTDIADYAVKKRRMGCSTEKLVPETVSLAAHTGGTVPDNGVFAYGTYLYNRDLCLGKVNSGADRIGRFCCCD